jgi:hypothetical protein
MTEHRDDPAPAARPRDPSSIAWSPPAPEPPAQNGDHAAPSRIEALEAELADWQRRAVIWRERALSTQALNDALNANLDDLRTMLPNRVPDEHDAHDASTPRAPVARAPGAPESFEPWWNRVFRRDTRGPHP